MEVLERTLSQLWCKKFLGILIAAIILTVVILTTANVAVMNLSKSVQMATFIDNMAYNITKKFTIQKHISQNILTRL